MDTKCITVKTSEQVNPKFVTLGYGSAAAATKTTFTAKAQEDVFLRYALLTADKDGMINDIRIGNQSLNCSDSDIEFKALEYSTKRRPLIGVAVDGNIQIAVDVTMEAAAVFGGGFSCEAIDKAPPLSAQAPMLNKFFGLGSVSVPAGGSASLSAQCLRGCLLRDLMLHAHSASAAGITVEDITVKGRSIFSGQAGDGIALDVLSTDAFAQYVSINTALQTNERVVVTLKNDTAGAVTVGGAVYAE